MGRTARDNRDRPHPRPVERIELNQENVGRRLAMTIVLLVFGAAMLTYAFVQLLSPDNEEWITIEANSGAGATCATEFELLYYPGRGGTSSAAERKEVTSLYTRLCREAFKLFQEREAFEGVNNIYAINRRPNQELEIDERLYEAFSAVERSGSRAIYLGPVYIRYDDLFLCQGDYQLVDFDPRLSEEVAREYREVLAFANDPEAIRIELLGENRIRLYVSQDYLDYAQREEIEDFIDFSWMRNAFIADFLAEGLIGGGYTSGVLSSYDGFIRNLDADGTGYSLQIYDCSEGMVYPVTAAAYQGPMSIVSLRDYPADERDVYRFYQLENGEIRTLYLDPADALCKSAIHHLTGYARDKSCGEILLALMPVYIADAFQPEKLERLAEEGVQSIFCQEWVMYYTDPAIAIGQLYDGNGVRYTASQLKP